MSRGRRPIRPRRQEAPARRGSIPLSSVARQVAVDRGPLGIAVLVITLVSFMTAVVPRFASEVAGREVRAAVADPTAGANVVVSVPLSEEFDFPRQPQVESAAQSAGIADRLTAGLPRVFAPPVTTIVSRDLKDGVINLHPVTLRLTYLHQDGGAAVTWTSGGPPGGSAQLTGIADVYGPAEVGLSQATAALLGVAVGDELEMFDPNQNPVAARVSGIFTPADSQDPAWAVAPTLITPKVIDGSLPRIEVSALLTDDSLPFGILALEPGMFSRAYTYRVEPDKIDAANAAGVATAIRLLTASPDGFGIPWESPSVHTRIDYVIDAALTRVRSANAQASLILVGVLATALLALVLASELIIERRSRVLRHQRSHGASLPSVAGSLVIESVAMTLLGWGVGLAVGALVLPGATSWAWVVPPLAISIAAMPTLGTLAAARRTAPPPAKRLGARSGAALAPARRLAGEAALVVIAVGALAAVRTRGVTASGDTLGADLMVLAAPTLAAGVVALALVRVLPPVWVRVRRATGRSRSAVPILAAARLRTAALPLTSLVLATALLVVSLAMGATVRAGEVAGSWESVGADAVAGANVASGLPAEISALRSSPGVDASAAALVVPGFQVLGTGVDAVVRFVVVDSSNLEELLAASPVADAPQLELLAAGSNDARPLPALTTGLPKGASGLSIMWAGARVAFTSVGVAPRLPGDPRVAPPTVLVDRATFEAVSGAPVSPGIVWVDGTGAVSALGALAGNGDFTVATREAWLDARRSAPVTAAFGGLLIAAACVLLALAVLVVGLVSVAGASGRGSALAGFRVLGLPRRQVDRVAVGEALAPVVAASLVGAASGSALAAWLVGPLNLAALTGQLSTPALVLPWWAWMAVPALVVAVLVAVAVELASHRRERLGQVMRAR